MDPDEHLPHDESLPWRPGDELDRVYRRRVRGRLAAGRTLTQAELEAFVDVAPLIPAEDRTPIEQALAPPGPDEQLPSRPRT